MNPQRLATKRLIPGFFRVQKGINIAGRTFDGVGNVALLHAEHYDVVHVRSIWVKAAEHGDSQPLRDYMNSRVLKARKGEVNGYQSVTQKTWSNPKKHVRQSSLPRDCSLIFPRLLIHFPEIDRTNRGRK